MKPDRHFWTYCRTSFGYTRSIYLFIFLFAASNYAVAQDIQQQTLQIIADFSDRICNENIHQRSSSELYSLDGDMELDLGRLWERLEGLGLGGRGAFSTSETDGVLQNQLANALRDQIRCKEGVFYALVDQFFPTASNVNPFRSDDGDILVPNQPSIIQPGQDFAMTTHDSRFVRNSDYMISTYADRGSRSPKLEIYWTHLSNGESDGTRSMGIGGQIAFDGCFITMYDADLENSLYSFRFLCK